MIYLVKPESNVANYNIFKSNYGINKIALFKQLTNVFFNIYLLLCKKTILSRFLDQ